MTAIPIVIILIKKYVTRNNTTIIQGSWKKVGSQFSITNIQVGKEGRGIPYCRYMCACRYISVCMYIWLCGHIPHFFLLDNFFFVLRFFEPRTSNTFFRMCEQRNTLFKTIKFLWNLK